MFLKYWYDITYDIKRPSRNAGCIAGVFKPSLELFPCVFQFVHERCFDTDAVGALACYALRKLMAKRRDINTPSARHQAEVLTSAELVRIAAAPLPPSVFGASIPDLRRLEMFAAEVVQYRDAVSNLNAASRRLQMDPIGGPPGGGVGSAGAKSSGGGGGDGGRGNTGGGGGGGDGSLFAGLSEEGVHHVTEGGVLHLKNCDDKKYRMRFVWVPDTLDAICWTRGTAKNEHKHKTVSLGSFTAGERGPPQLGYDAKDKDTNPYLYFTLRSRVGSNAKDRLKHSMDFKTDASSSCEKWVVSLRALLETASGSRRMIEQAARETLRASAAKHLPVIFTVEGAGQADANGDYRSVQRTKNGARLYMSAAGFVLSREIIEGKAGWIIGKDQVRSATKATFASVCMHCTDALYTHCTARMHLHPDVY